MIKPDLQTRTPQGMQHTQMGEGEAVHAPLHVTSKNQRRSQFRLRRLLTFTLLLKHLCSVCWHHGCDAFDTVLQNALDTVRQRKLRHRAALASTLKLNRYNAVFGHVHEDNIAAICLKARANLLNHLVNLCSIYHSNSFES
jgi:hypothetical protein